DFGKFETGFEQLRDVRCFKVEKLGALRIDEGGFWCRVHAGIGVGKIFARVRSAQRVREITGSQELEARAIQVDAIKMSVIGIFTVFTAVGGEIEGAGFLIERNN